MLPTGLGRALLLSGLPLQEQLSQGQIHGRGHLHGALVTSNDDDAAAAGLNEAGIVGGGERLVPGPLGAGAVGGDEHGGRESLGGLDRPEPVASGGADDGLGLPHRAGLDLLDGIGHGQRRDHGLVSGPHGRDHPLRHLRRRQRPRGVVDDDDVGLRHGGQGRCEPEGHRGLSGTGRAGNALDPRAPARRGPDRSVRQARELGAEPGDLLSGGGDDDVADDA